MAATNTVTKLLGSAGDNRVSVVQLVADASYPTGGYSIPLATFGLGRIQWTEEQIKVPVAGAQYAVYNTTTNKLQFFVTAGTEVANATSLVGLTAIVTAYGNAS